MEMRVLYYSGSSHVGSSYVKTVTIAVKICNNMRVHTGRKP
jgi:hypothetical protein